MLSRRSFLGSMLATAAAKFLVLQEGDDGVQITDNKQIPKPKDMPVTFHFGDLALLASDPAELKIHTPMHKDFAGRTIVDRMTHVYVTKLVGPKAAFEQIYKTYGMVDGLPDRLPLTIKMGEQTLATIDSCLLQGVGWSVQAEDMVVVENIYLVGLWRELREAQKKWDEAAKAYYEAQEKEVALKNKTLGGEKPKEEFFCEDCNDFHD